MQVCVVNIGKNLRTGHKDQLEADLGHEPKHYNTGVKHPKCILTVVPYTCPNMLVLNQMALKKRCWKMFAQISPYFLMTRPIKEDNNDL